MNPSPEIPPLQTLLSGYRADAVAFEEASGKTHVLDALLWDACARNGQFLSRPELSALRGATTSPLLVALACAVVFRLPRLVAAKGALQELFTSTLPELSRLSAGKMSRWRDDPEGVEELVRLVLRDLHAAIPGESTEVSQDRLQAVSLLERRRLLSISREAEKRAREIREALAAKAAKEAADKYGRA
jgi:hypothetical protein